MSLSSYITHPTGAGPGGPPAHKGAPPGHLYLKVACIIYGNTANHNYYTK